MQGMSIFAGDAFRGSLVYLLDPAANARRTGWRTTMLV